MAAASAMDDIDYYAVLEVKQEATLQEIKSAYRQRSLKVHPDRNPDNPLAATQFNALRQAYDLLSDPTQRSTFDTLLKSRQARAERFKGLSSKRQAMAQDLAEREKEFKRTRGEFDVKERGEREELARIREEGRKLREARDLARGMEEDRDDAEQIRRQEERKRAAQEQQEGIVELGALDKTLKLRWARGKFPELVSKQSLVDWIVSNIPGIKTGEIDSIVLGAKFMASLLLPLDNANTSSTSDPPEKKKKKEKEKFGNGMVAFTSLKAAVGMMEASASEGGNWQGMEVDWASGERPAVLGPKEPKEGLGGHQKVEKKGSVPSFSTSSILVDADEDRILAMMRAKERAKIIADLEKEDLELL